MTVCAILGLPLGKHFLQLGLFDRLSEEELCRAAHAWLLVVQDSGDERPARGGTGPT
ncbi:hypothetical protein [Tomitella fengzijianii]|uniref:hypothetical protein n=1 Tax=Tomitella fengzijianii TaxID=2597660 RepID=UPI00131CA5DF|nr:hypothetical protein [Tomitella fengzijianii]